MMTITTTKCVIYKCIIWSYKWKNKQEVRKEYEVRQQDPDEMKMNLKQ